MYKRLYRSQTDRMIAGVCGGIGQYFNIDSTLIRIIFIVFLLWGGGGLLAYIICWIVIPLDTSVQKDYEDIIQENSKEIKDTVTKAAKGLKTEISSDTKVPENEN